MDAIGCIILPRTPIIPKSKALIERLANETVGRFTFNATSKNPSLEGPAPCYLLGRPELAYVYFGAGLLTAIVIALIVDSPSIFRFFVDLCTCKDPAKEQEEDGESEELLQATAGEDSTDKVKANPAIDNTVLNRVRELERKKAGQARIWAYIIAAASELTLTGQTWVRRWKILWNPSSIINLIDSWLLQMLLGVVSSGVSHAIYLSLVSNKSRTMEACATRNDWLQWTDFAMNIFLAIYFLVRAAGSEQKLRVVLSLHSFGDYFNVPNALINPFLSRQFTGFGFMRFFNYLWLIEILTNTGLLRSANKIRLVQLILKVLALISIAAGFLHLAENLGDPWLDDLYNGQQIMFWKCFLYVYGRVTLLDLSGMRLHTTSGRVIIYSFQLLALGVIAKALPEILTHFKVQPAYDKGYKATSSYLHVIVTGNVTYYNMKNIVQEFYHGDRTYAQHFKIVMLSDDPPDENMQRLLKRFYTKLEYKRGTVMKLKDLERIKVMDAAATLILSNSNSLDADADDAANIMRVVSIKNVKSDARVIVQLNHHQNKARKPFPKRTLWVSNVRCSTATRCSRLTCKTSPAGRR
ncbi:hypothetical protein RvY_11044 [Ramazzottius varieornatus]|uniref:RCK N-terminal domain-containing protein n=1 Tax=Ramazzottius varieornatus TaxID=947166 RepID=A0A1D1VH91_RAMVA|nr:hypothetical protein RvY_11044 [Ramazzottius varieornatus]